MKNRKVAINNMLKHRYIPSSIYRAVKTRKTCRKCGKVRGKQLWQIHHIIPVSEGGTNKENNLLGVCQECHKKIHGEGK